MIKYIFEHENTRDGKMSVTVIKAAFLSFSSLVLILLISKLWISSIAGGRISANVDTTPKEEVAMVLGADVYKNGELSPILKDRVDKGIELYKAERCEKLLMSGDDRECRQVERMAEYAVKNGVPKKDIVMDFYSRRTYDSVWRAKHVFGLEDMLVVSQKCHDERTLFLCDSLGVRAFGVSSDNPSSIGTFSGKVMCAREFPACLKALIDVYLKRPSVIERV